MKLLFSYVLKWGLLFIYLSLLMGVIVTYSSVSFHVVNWLLFP